LQNRLAEAQRQFDFVLLSGGSVLEDPAGLALLPNAGSVLLLVLENETRVEDLEAAERALALCKARNVRIVLTSPVRGELGFARSAGSSGGA
jgi:shikimate kinase